ncbi:haloalkane dehalogenase [Tahibacter soli]|uniref:Haloalkane dehalogenase n=1 Tax=Tahibacter soli TaxID=2983605 RepID=A0A9X3YKI0_9GAMM|nr:haloalkane dehalogenase [Tahibacter soli]MDC8014019.1 haloalkane dehalogenase [Tahibacter soli]
MTEPIDPTDHHPRHRINLLDTELSYVDVGAGDPIVFLHGNPTWSYVWRNVIPHVADIGRCLAPDLVGMGQSGPSATGTYRFIDHARHLDAWFDALALERVVLVVQAWGSGLGFDWARRHPSRVAGIAHMESLVLPRRWEDFPGTRAQVFADLRGERGVAMVFDDNYFVEQGLPRGIRRTLSDAEMAMYRMPFARRESRQPMLDWAREQPIGGEPADVLAIVEAYGAFMATTSIPKLFVNADPGSLVTGDARDFCRTWPAQREVTVPGLFTVQEDSPHAIGAALREFVLALRGG